MQSNNSKKTFRPETEEKGRKRNSQKKQAAAAGVAMTAIAVILLGAGIGYSVQRAGKTESISLEEMQNSVSSALKGEMESAATSLEQLNQNIADNQKKLDEVNAQLAQREDSLLQVGRNDSTQAGRKCVRDDRKSDRSGKNDPYEGK